MIKHFCYFVFGISSFIESAINLFLYTTFLYKIMPVCDFSFNLHFWLTNKLLKKGYLESIKDYGENI